MVAIVEVQPVHVLVYRVEDHDLHADTLQCVDLLVAEAHHAAEVIKEELNLHALRPLAAEDIQHPVEDLAPCHNVVFQKDEALRLLHVLQQIAEIRLASGEIFRLGAVVQGEAAPCHVAGQTVPLRHLLCQRRRRGGALLHLDGTLRRKRHLFQRQPLGTAFAVPQPVQDQTRGGYHQDQQDPADLVAAAAGAGVDASGHDQCQHLQQRIGQRHFLLQQHGQPHHQCDLHQQQQRHQRKPQSGADPPFRFLLYSVLFHGAPFGIG